MYERCELTELLKSQCAHCLKHKLPDEEEEVFTFESLLNAKQGEKK